MEKMEKMTGSHFHSYLHVYMYMYMQKHDQLTFPLLPSFCWALLSPAKSHTVTQCHIYISNHHAFKFLILRETCSKTCNVHAVPHYLHIQYTGH